MAVRSGVGTALVRDWARRHVAPGATILDVGCGSGVPIAQALVADGYRVAGIDPSPTLIAAFGRALPGMPAACEPAQDSGFFGRSFPAIVAIGLIFLLDGEDQARLIGRLAGALEPGGRLLFSAPRQPCEWHDTLTGRASRSLGADAYVGHLDAAGLRWVACHADDGGNDYFDAVRPV
jgi:SAM-dependent methyltransferase